MEEEILNMEKELLQIAHRLKNIKNLKFKDELKKDYDKVGFVYDLKYTIGQLEYFFDSIVVKQTRNPNTSYYHLTKLEPKEHQVAYINLTRGFPKELFGGHYCYILKKFKDKYLVIPTTSVENEEIDIRQDFEINITINNFINTKVTRLNLSNMRTIDIQRIYQSDNMFELEKGIFDVKTDKHYIEEEVKKILFGCC